MHRWVESRTAEEILQNLQREKLLNLFNLPHGWIMASICGIDIAERSESGRVTNWLLRLINRRFRSADWQFAGFWAMRRKTVAEQPLFPENIFI